MFLCKPVLILIHDFHVNVQSCGGYYSPFYIVENSSDKDKKSKLSYGSNLMNEKYPLRPLIDSLFLGE